MTRAPCGLIIFRPGIAMERILKTGAEPASTRPLIRVGRGKPGRSPPDPLRDSGISACRFDTDRTAFDQENNQRSGHRKREIPAKGRRQPPRKLDYFPG